MEDGTSRSPGHNLHTDEILAVRPHLNPMGETV
jgi:hypothetical protein